MKMIILDQGTDAWLKWRNGGIGASDCAAVFGKSPYLTRRTLWEEKTGQREPKPISEFAQRKGGEIEARVRAMYSLHLKKDFRPCTAEHEKYPYILASFDGRDFDSGEIIEIKFVGKEKYELGREAVPDHHIIQMQQQMLVSGAPYVDYLFSTDGDDYKLERFFADKIMQAEILENLTAFYAHMVNKTDPGFAPDDIHPVRDKAMIKRLAAWKKAALAALKAVEKADALKPERTEFEFKKMSVESLGLEIVKTQVKGSVDYSIVPELSGVDLDKYRKDASLKFEIKIKKAKKTGKTV